MKYKINGKLKDKANFGSPCALYFTENSSQNPHEVSVQESRLRSL